MIAFKTRRRAKSGPLKLYGLPREPTQRRFVHNLRHYFGTALFRAGVNPRVAQELLGHADLTTTMRYAHVEAIDLKTGIARLETFVASHAPVESPPASGARPVAQLTQ